MQKCFFKLNEKYVLGKSFSEALVFASTNPKYDKRLFLDLPVQYMKLQAELDLGNEIVNCATKKDSRSQYFQLRNEVFEILDKKKTQKFLHHFFYLTRIWAKN